MFIENLFYREHSVDESNVSHESDLTMRKAMARGKNDQAVQGSPGKHRRASWTLKEEELPFLEANRFLFTVAKYFGFHNITRNSRGTLETSVWRMVPILFHFTIGLAGFLVAQYLWWFTELDYYQVVLLTPISFGCGFCFEAYFSIILLAKQYIKYLSEIEAQDVRMKSFNMPCMAAGTFASSVAYTACILRVTNFSTKVMCILLIPVLLTTFLPLLLDTAMFCFTLMLRQEILKLKEHIQRVRQWTRAEVSVVFARWLRLCRLFRLHNHVFQGAVHSSTLQCMVKVMAFAYALIVIDYMMKELIAQNSQAVVVLSIVAPLGWAFLRSLSLTFNGEVINYAHAGVLDEVRAVVVRGATSLEGPDGMNDLRRLLGHMEARPLTLQIWGRDDLGAGVFVQNTGMVLTYLVMVVQMQPTPNPNFSVMK